jgi:hypothetical protein
MCCLTALPRFFILTLLLRWLLCEQSDVLSLVSVIGLLQRIVTQLRLLLYLNRMLVVPLLCSAA